MKDFFGTEINVGDVVAFEAPGYRMLVLGTVIPFTPEQVRLEYINTWNYASAKQQYLTPPSHCIVKPKGG